MKYLTREELEDITNELLENPTRETLKKLNDKYNGSMEEEYLSKETLKANTEIPAMTPIPDFAMGNSQVIQPTHSSAEDELATPIVNLNVPNIEVPKTENVLSPNYNNVEVPSFEIPKAETLTSYNKNNQVVNFNGNLWQQPQNSVENLMQTTDNFASSSNTISSTDVPVTGAPFFGPIQEQVNNPIPVSSSPIEGPTMFGQFEQNYM